MYYQTAEMMDATNLSIYKVDRLVLYVRISMTCYDTW